MHGRGGGTTGSGDAPWRGRQLVFVGGLHRSGTTVLARMLETAPGAAGLDGSPAPMGEGQHLQLAYPTGIDYGGATRWAWHPRSHLTEQDATADTAADLWAAWHPWWGDEATLLVEKSPPNLTKLRYLQAAFPDARFIVITRHPVAQAYALHRWNPTVAGKLGVGFTRQVEHWVHAHETFRADAPYVRHLLVLRYEHLITAPERELARVERFLRVQLPDRAAGMADPAALDAYVDLWARLRSGRRASSDTRAKERLRTQVERVTIPLEVRRMRRLADRVAALGYRLDDLRSAERWEPSTVRA